MFYFPDWVLIWEVHSFRWVLIKKDVVFWRRTNCFFDTFVGYIWCFIFDAFLWFLKLHLWNESYFQYIYTHLANRIIPNILHRGCSLKGCLLMFSLFLWPGAYLRGGLLCMYTGHKILFHRDNKFSLLLYYCTMNNLSVPLFHWNDRVTTERQTN